jgi:hypothetical protein
VKSFALIASIGCAVLAGTAPAFAKLYLVTVPLSMTGVPAGTTITVACHPGKSLDKDKGAIVDGLISDPPKDAAKTTVVAGATSATIALDVALKKDADGRLVFPSAYECWSDYGGYVSGAFPGSGSSSSPGVSPTPAFDVHAVHRS